MKELLVILAVICHVSGDDVRAAFQKAMAKYATKDGLQLSESPEISKKRFKSFVKFHAMVEKINQDDTLPYMAADNFMSILTEEERNRHLGLNITGYLGDISDTVHVESQRYTELPKTRDFSLLISGVKDQGSCGSCWTFPATVALKGEIYFKTGTKHVSLSEQEYMDCATPNDGCNCVREARPSMVTLTLYVTTEWHPPGPTGTKDMILKDAWLLVELSMRLSTTMSVLLVSLE